MNAYLNENPEIEEKYCKEAMKGYTLPTGAMWPKSGKRHGYHVYLAAKLESFPPGVQNSATASSTVWADPTPLLRNLRRSLFEKHCCRPAAVSCECGTSLQVVDKKKVTVKDIQDLMSTSSAVLFRNPPEQKISEPATFKAFITPFPIKRVYIPLGTDENKEGKMELEALAEEMNLRRPKRAIFPNHTGSWNPTMYNHFVAKFEKLLKKHYPLENKLYMNSVFSEDALPRTETEREFNFVCRVGYLLAVLGGSGSHVDVSSKDFRSEKLEELCPRKLSGAVGHLVQGTKYMWTMNRFKKEHLSLFENWTKRRIVRHLWRLDNGLGHESLTREELLINLNYVLTVMSGVCPGPFQSKFSFGWSTVADYNELVELLGENVVHFHSIEQFDSYLLFAGVLSFVMSMSIMSTFF